MCQVGTDVARKERDVCGAIYPAMERPDEPPLSHTSDTPGWRPKFLSPPGLGTLSETMVDCQVGIFEPTFLSVLPL